MPYKAVQGACDANNKAYEYKIVKGFKMHYEENASYSDGTFEELLNAGPLIVGMDASFQGFGQYRPTTFEPLNPIGCGQQTHAVVVVGEVEENGKRYILARNSWGENWGYKGYFKMPKDNNCSMTKYAWLPGVYDGHVPSENPPKPEPPAPTDCVEVYSSQGFDSTPKAKICDSKPGFGGYAIVGVKYPPKTVNPVIIRLFYYTQCYGLGDHYDKNIVIEESTEFPQFEGKTQVSSSLAFDKRAEDGCVNFYKDTCLAGESISSICNDIKDSQDANLAGLVSTKSITFDKLKIKRVTYNEKKNEFDKRGSTR